MLDQQSVNYGILRNWFGDSVAEPQWQGQNTVQFFARQGEGGILSNAACRPVSKSDLETVFAEDLQKIKTRIRKTKPESSTEQLLLRIVKESFQKLTADLEVSDYDSFLFKVRRPGEPWRLVWCWGYQRTDQQPSPALVCPQKDCRYLFVRRPKSKPVCPLCQESAGPRGLLSPKGGLTTLLLLALLLLLAYFILPPKLSVVPGDWQGPSGSRVPFIVQETRLFFFHNDVSTQSLAQSHDSRVIEFEHGIIGKAKNQGQTIVTFRRGNQVVDIAVVVGPLTPPKSIRIDADAVNLAVGSTYTLKAEGTYEDGSVVDVTDIVQWTSEQAGLVMFHNGYVEGMSPGESKLIAKYPTGPDEAAIEDTAELSVVTAEYASLVAGVDPSTIPLGQTGEMEIIGTDTENNEWQMTGSSMVATVVAPANVASINVQYLKGLEIGSAELVVSLDDLNDRAAFQVGPGTLGDVFAVSPSELQILVDEYFELEVLNGTGQEVVAVSSDTSIVEVFDDFQITGRQAGTAEITLTCGEQTQTVKVEVIASDFKALFFDPYLISLDVGETRELKVFANTEFDTTIEVAPDRLTWLKQPISDVASINRNTLTITGMRPSASPQDIEVQLGPDGFIADATVEVVGADLAIDEGEFGAHPPINLNGQSVVAGSIVGDGLIYDGNSVVVGNVDPFSAIGEIPRGSRITSVNGNNLTNLDTRGLRDYFSTHPIGSEDVLEYVDRGGASGALIVGGSLGVTQDIKAIEIATSNVNPDNFAMDMKLFVRVPADYRLSDSNGDSLSEWQTAGGGSVILLSSSAIPRNASDEYEFFVDRETAEGTKRFQINFKLEN
jgi:hypothetical protein